jgi:hypothetical protein
VRLVITPRLNSFTPIGGLSAVICGLLVAVRQLIPEHAIGSSTINLRAKYIPFMALTVLSMSAIAGVTDAGTLIYALCGLQFGWLYLRYFQRRDGGRGDMSDTFAYDGFFPEPIATPVRLVGAILFVLFRPILLSAQNVGSEEKDTVHAASAADSADAERHRQRALKALDERLSAAKNNAFDPPV